MCQSFPIRGSSLLDSEFNILSLDFVKLLSSFGASIYLFDLLIFGCFTLQCGHYQVIITINITQPANSERLLGDDLKKAYTNYIVREYLLHKPKNNKVK